ncbi:MAG: nucleotide sugar dehydrogenase [Chloroflexota bacterium]|nr:nucleotide sugar dehydrogenase [Chloroflexota bacterium]MDE2945865.1 nucleotide sugar dehydrogenase [Chloroflexota bacterium]
MSDKHNLLQKIADREARVGVVGLGYVGLPLAVEFAEAGFNVTGIDVDRHKVRQLNQGRSYIDDVSSERVHHWVANGKFCASASYDALRAVDAISICVPTPLRKTRDPDMSYIIDAARSIARIRRQGMLIVLESTTYPGTTEEIILPEIVGGAFTVGEDFFIAYSPERIDPGNARYTVRNTPKVVGGITANCAEVATALYESAVDQIIKVSSPTAAEMVKLLENTFRAVNIGLVNEMALMCDKLDIDVWEVIQAAASKPFGYMPFYPGPGLGGHCIPVDPHYLSWKLKTLNYKARFIELASEINTAMPYYVIDKITEALNNQERAVRGSRILILGAAYKANVDDVRESPALDIISLLRQRGAEVAYCDPHVPQIQLESELRLQAKSYSAQLLRDAHCVVVVTDHAAFDWEEIARNSKVLVDTRHVYRDRRDGHIISL